MKVEIIIQELERIGATLVKVGPHELVLKSIEPNKQLRKRAVWIVKRYRPLLHRHFKIRCLNHLPPFRQDSYEEVVSPARPGWIRTQCRICCHVVGYRPLPELLLIDGAEQADQVSSPPPVTPSLELRCSVSPSVTSQ